jgi:ribosomal protein L11 methyltransferase
VSATDKTEKRYFEVSLVISRERQELVCDYIIQNIVGGVVIEDEEDAAEVALKFYVPESRGEGFKNELAAYLSERILPTGYNPENIKSKLIADIEWIQAYKDSIKPVIIGNISVRPPWAQASPKQMFDIIIEPKMAFGTGSHETTRLCLSEIGRHFRPGKTMFDLGCGSGVLSILAAKMGAGSVTGVDIDLVAVENARENIVINGVEKTVRIEFGSIEKAEDRAKYDFLAANLIKSSIVNLYDNIRAAVKSEGIILLSGLLIQDKEDIDGMLATRGDDKFVVNQDGQWLAYTVFTK